MKALVKECRAAWEAVGKVQYGPVQAEIGFLRGRRSLYVVEDMKAGEVFTALNVRSIRPGFGLPPKHYESILGKRILRDAPKGTALAWDMISN
jgi:N-acetylneuraminate synthase